jgi:hypothetical protein
MPSAGDPQVCGHLYRRIVHQRISASTQQRQQLSNLFCEFANKMASSSFITDMNLIFESFAQIAIQA